MRPTDPRLRARLAPARAPLAGVLASGVLGAALVVAQAWLVTGLVVAVVRREDVVPWGLGVVAVLLGRAVSGALGDLLAARAATRVATDLRARLLARLADGVAVPPVLLTRGVAAAEPYLTRYLPALVLAALLPPLVVVAMATQDLLSAAIVVATLPLVPVFGGLVGLATRDRAAQQWRAMASLSGHFLDVVRGLPTLVAHRRAVAQSHRVAEVTERYRVATLRTLRIAFASSAVLELVATLSVALVAVTVGVRLAQGDLDLRTALVVLLLAPEAYWPLRRVGAEFHAAAEGVATFEQAHALLDAGPSEEAVPAEGDLVLDEVSVTYPGRTSPALAPLTAVVQARGVTAVTGPSGCGKSTLLRVVAGLVEHEGVVTGRPSREQVGWLPQQPRFVCGSVADNLRLARPDATDVALWDALRRVALAERVAALPRGLDSTLGEDGLSLSAGERARLALARVVLADRPWSLLDEPTAHLDELTEQVICDVVHRLGRRGAVLVVAHRPALRAVADHVLPLLPADPPQMSADPPEMCADPPEMPAFEADGRADEAGRRGGLEVATVIGALASASGVALTATAGWLIVQASTQPAVLTLLVAVVGVRAFGLARPVLRYAERLRAHDAALRMLARRRVQVYDALVPLVPGRVGRRGDVLGAVVDDVDGVVDRELRVRMPLRQAVAVVLLAGAVTAWLLPAAGAAVLTGGLVATSSAYGLGRWGGSRAERDAVATRARLSEQVVEATQVAEELRMWQAVDAVVARASATSDTLGRAAEQSMRWLTVARATVMAVTGLGVAVAAWLVSPVVGQAVSAPVAALLVLVPLALADVLLPVADAGALSARTAAAAARLAALESAAPAVDDTGRHPAGDDPTTAVHGARLRGLALSLALDPGERLVVVGPSGSGKSTLASLLLRFLDPEAGVVSRGGVPLRELALDEVRRTTGLVDDAPYVFATTLVENVRLARPGATDAEVARALRRARLGGWLDALPDGLHTWLGEGHAEVSGGERARLGVARSLLADQAVLVLDEPTAHLDHATAEELAREVLTGPRERSVLWITHEPVGLPHADRVQDLGPAPAGSSAAAARALARRG
ncbi:thiol reductant ABC exporter subunit CydD [Nocardioides aequoreus]|uniref:thiol reductant ABC exporter subunit CydD n=1 Tax=Nocardioides aequoreus TaxID=397278 RepID=UPI00068D804E|nr:thiol reductant ABC exporter subunit CydD [Nocardioides aequoreus]